MTIQVLSYNRACELVANIDGVRRQFINVSPYFVDKLNNAVANNKQKVLDRLAKALDHDRHRPQIATSLF